MVVEVLEEVKTEVDKEKPNRIKVGSLLTGIGGTVQAIAAAPDAWTTVTSWYDFMKSAVC